MTKDSVTTDLLSFLTDATTPFHAVGVMAERLVAAGTDFVIPPRIRFEGEPGEQATLFFRDPAGNALEFKSFRDPALLFAVS